MSYFQVGFLTFVNLSSRSTISEPVAFFSSSSQSVDFKCGSLGQDAASTIKLSRRQHLDLRQAFNFWHPDGGRKYTSHVTLDRDNLSSQVVTARIFRSPTTNFCHPDGGRKYTGHVTLDRDNLSIQVVTAGIFRSPTTNFWHPDGGRRYTGHVTLDRDNLSMQVVTARIFRSPTTNFWHPGGGRKCKSHVTLDRETTYLFRLSRREYLDLRQPTFGIQVVAEVQKSRDARQRDNLFIQVVTAGIFRSPTTV
ncbi:hypothetical protein RRG08_044257 [Elysia crispata]|uniref:Uncharacterized protein n=1 Tax=Elysia crispata TaxID=231223 RepID=A0AAE0XWZ9_9GAST|nr:hypothetical protein RRG08_044257 [Elysia crispata]